MEKRALGRTGLQIAPLVLGGNVFGWTIDEKASFNVLDAFVERGFNAIDTADVYSRWVDGNHGGESETIIGNWLKARPGMREQVLIFTKVGSDMGEPGHKGLGKKWIMQAVEDSLRRLQTDYVDLYFSHWPDAESSYKETLEAYAKLLEAGKIRAIGASNLNAEQLGEALRISAQKELPRYDVLQPEYNLYDRAGFDGPLRDLCIREEIGVVAYYSLASGFLTGKYRSQEDLGKSRRGEGIKKYLNARGMAILEALDRVGKKYSASPAEVALAWTMARKGITAPIASATSVSQVDCFARAVGLSLGAEDIVALCEASV